MLRGVSPGITAGAVISGAYLGDKLSPLSETTILVPKLVGRGLTVDQHVRNMFWTAGPAIGTAGDGPRIHPQVERGPGIHAARALIAEETNTSRSPAVAVAQVAAGAPANVNGAG